MNRFQGAYLGLVVLTLSGFTLTPSPEMRLNVCVLILPLMLAVWAVQEGIRPGAFAAIFLFAGIALGLERTTVFSGVESGVLTGFIAGASAAALADRPRTALAVAASVRCV